MKLKYYHNLDGLRGIAALMVLVFHFFYTPFNSYLPNIDLYQKITEFGQHGVSMFFVLSGFVITRILLNERANDNYFRRFYLRRVLRILPLYYLFLIVYYLFPLTYNGSIVDFELQIPFYFYLQNLKEVLAIDASGPGHYWTLAVEEHFYLLWPLIVFYSKPKNLWKIILVVTILIFVLKYNMLLNDYSINKFSLTRMDQMLLGGVLAVLELNHFFEKKVALNLMIISCLSIIPLGIFLYLFSAEFIYAKEMLKYPILGLLFFSLIGYLIVLKKNHFLNRILTSNVMQYLGKISFGIYVWHVLALDIMDVFFSTEILIVDIFLAFFITILLAHISYYYFEKYFLKFKKTV